MYHYDANFYSFLSSFALRSATVIVPIVADALPIRSVADFGCGQGAWLSVWQKSGAAIFGVDGPYVDQTRLLIPTEAFQPADLSQPLNLGRRFDLAQSLEVAEHLPAAAAQTFVRSLVCHSDHILFSAAVPGQGGERHINEQEPKFWRPLFAAEGYRPVDLVRPAVRNNPAVQRWYACNTILYVKTAALDALSSTVRQYVVVDDQPLTNYWPLGDRIRQGVVRKLPSAVVDGLSRINAARVASQAHRRSRKPSN